MRNETRNCDGCGEEIYKDTGVWIGGMLHLIRYFVESNAFATEWTKDLCPGCADAIERFIEELIEIEKEKK